MTNDEGQRTDELFGFQPQPRADKRAHLFHRHDGVTRVLLRGFETRITRINSVREQKCQWLRDQFKVWIHFHAQKF